METSTQENPKELTGVIVAAYKKHNSWLVPALLATVFVIFISYTFKLK